MNRVLITGANRGIGLAMARHYASRGDEVIAVCRRSDRELDRLPVTVVEGIDVTRPEDARRLTGETRDRPLDVLVNNAGLMSGQRLGGIDEGALEDMLAQFRVNALGPLLVTQALLGSLGEGARVGIVTSRMGSIADNTSGNSYGYRMSKAAANMAGASLAHDLRERGIAVALLHPGWVRTGMTGGSGHVDADEAAAGLVARLDGLTLADSGGFWHANGERLPW